MRRSDLLYKLIRAVGDPVFHFIYRLKIEGRENIPRDGPGILLPKHQFWTDIPIVGVAVWRPVSYVAKRELFVYPVVRHFLTALGGIPLDRQNPLKSLDSFRHLEKLVKDEEFIVIFPEGTYYPYSLGRGKHRLIERILRLQEKMGWKGERAIPFIPLGISYPKEIFRAEVAVKIGRPLYFQGESGAQEFTRQIIEAYIQSLLVTAKDFPETLQRGFAQLLKKK